ncbi:MAG: hypothetical protein AB9M53_00415 [Leptothrix sp. (in: b-proteobacteria)]
MKTITLRLSAGTLVLGPMLAATMRDHAEGIAQWRDGALAAPELMLLTSQLALACARRVEPTLTLEVVEGLVDMENFTQVMNACWGISVPEVLPGEAMQAVSPST